MLGSAPSSSSVRARVRLPFSELVQIGVLGKRGGRHRSLLSLCRPVRDAGRKEGVNSDAVALPVDGWAQPFPRTRRRPTRHPHTTRNTARRVVPGLTACLARGKYL